MPEGGVRQGDQPTDIVDAFKKGAMISLRFLEIHPSVIVVINLAAVGYHSKVTLRMFPGWRLRNGSSSAHKESEQYTISELPPLSSFTVSRYHRYITQTRHTRPNTLC